MKILHWYIVKTMLHYTSAVMFIWLCVYGFFNFLDEVKLIGQSSYSTWEATKYVLLDLFSVLYTHSSAVILLGSILSLGHLASTSQLIILQASGISILQITKTVIKGSLVFILIIVSLGEIVAPPLVEYAENNRAKALGERVSSQTDSGFWLKDKDTIIHVKEYSGSNFFKDVTLIDIFKSNEIEKITQSSHAILDEEILNLNNVQSYNLEQNKDQVKITQEEFAKYGTEITFDEDILEGLKKEPYKLSSWEIYKQINFLRLNNLETDLFEVELYKRIVRPITLVSMVLLSMLFVFGSLRDSTLGKKIFLGLIVSLLFEMISRFSGIASLRFELNHFLSVASPTLVVLFFSYILIRRKSLG